MPLCCNVILLFEWVGEYECVLPSSHCPILIAASQPQGRSAWNGAGVVGLQDACSGARRLVPGAAALLDSGASPRVREKYTNRPPGHSGSQAEHFFLVS